MFNEKSCLVLSPSRTGSTRLTKLISNKYFKPSELALDKNVKQCITEGKIFITRSYEILQRSTFPNITTIYSVRENFIDSILSQYIVQKFKLWLPNQIVVPFVASIDELEEIIFFQMTWYNNYSSMLTPTSHVVIFEIFQSICPYTNENELDKKAVIKNYDNIVLLIKGRLTKHFLANHEEFIDYKRRVNCQEVYHWLQKSA